MKRNLLSSLMMLALLFGTMAVPMTALAEGATVTIAVETAAPAAAPAVAPAKEEAAPAVAAAPAKSDAPKEHVHYFKKTFWSLVPPLVAIALALITKEVYSSLFIGIVLGAFFAGEGKFLKSIDYLINDGFIEAVKGTAGIFIFLVILGIIVSLVNRTGGAQAFGEWTKKHVHSRVGAMLMTFLLGVLIFIDDYFNCLTVGSVMQPVTDSHKISRAKLSYLIDATAAPICMIAPISSWAAAVSNFTKGTGLSGIELFCKAIPYNFYSLLTILFIIITTLMKIDFGPMRIHEFNAMTKGDLFTNGGEVDNGVETKKGVMGKVSYLVLPIFFLIIACVFALVYVGGILEDGKGFVAAFSDTDATVALPWGGMIALFLIILFVILVIPNFSLNHKTVLSPRETMDSIPHGFIAMVPAIIILTMATTLKNMTGLLEAKDYIAMLMEHAATGLTNFLPFVIFLVACILSFATGTSWGTFGILIPIVANIFPGDSPLLIIGMSACLAGAVCGDHCSPISDTTIMSSAGARCEHINHVSTQLPYAIFVAIVSAIGFILAGLTKNWTFSFIMSLLIMFIALVVIKAIQKPLKEEQQDL